MPNVSFFWFVFDSCPLNWRRFLWWSSNSGEYPWSLRKFYKCDGMLPAITGPAISLSCGSKDESRCCTTSLNWEVKCAWCGGSLVLLVINLNLISAWFSACPFFAPSALSLLNRVEALSAKLSLFCLAALNDWTADCCREGSWEFTLEGRSEWSSDVTMSFGSWFGVDHLTTSMLGTSLRPICFSSSSWSPIAEDA